MQPNTFIFCDASFYEQKQVACVAVVIDSIPYTDLIEANSSNQAEESALFFALDTAYKLNKLNVVIVYDCLELNTEKIKQFYKDKFEYVQFLWTKREHIDFVDKIARKTLSAAISDVPLAYNKNRDIEIIKTFAPYVDDEARFIFGLLIDETIEPKKILSPKHMGIAINIIYFSVSFELRKKIKEQIDFIGPLNKYLINKNGNESYLKFLRLYGLGKYQKLVAIDMKKNTVN